MNNSMVLIPRLSEKAYGLSQSSNVYVLQVPSDANKLTIAHAISTQFKVTVRGVNISNAKGKTMRTVRRGGRRSSGKRPDMKKAYVTLKAGDTLPIFASEEDQKPDKTKKEAKK